MALYAENGFGGSGSSFMGPRPVAPKRPRQDWNFWQQADPNGDPNAFNPNFHEPDPRRVSGNLLKGLSLGLNKYMPFLTDEAIPGQIAAGRNILQMTTPGGIQSKVSSTRKSLLSDAQRQSKMLNMRLDSQGGGMGTKMGADVSTFNAANDQANQLQAYYATPQGQYELYQIINQLTQQYPGMDVMKVLSDIFQQGTQINNSAPDKGMDWGGLLGGIGAVAGAI